MATINLSFQMGDLTYRYPPIPPLSCLSPQNHHTVDAVGDGLPFFRCPPMISGKHAMHFTYFSLRSGSLRREDFMIISTEPDRVAFGFSFIACAF